MKVVCEKCGTSQYSSGRKKFNCRKCGSPLVDPRYSEEEEELTDEQKTICHSIQLQLCKVIMDISEDVMWECISKAIKKTENDRLATLEGHFDTYETIMYCFEYHEMAGLSSITVYEDLQYSGTLKLIEIMTLDEPKSHEEFISICNDYCRRHDPNGKTDEPAAGEHSE